VGKRYLPTALSLLCACGYSLASAGRLKHHQKPKQ
jgi:hypothetical protein